jgi:hypothetical protein
LPNLDNKNQNISYTDQLTEKTYGGKLEYSFIYGIKNFVSSATKLETGLNDSAYLTYTLTGDDLRYNDSDLPRLDWNFSNKDKIGNETISYEGCWTVELSYARIYTAENQAEPYVVYFTKNNNGTNNIEYYDYELGEYKYDTFIKVEFVFRIIVNQIRAKEYFENNTIENISSYFTCTTYVSKLNIDNQNYDAVTRQISSKFVINRQKNR